MRSLTHKIALGGVLAALAVVIMTMVGLIPVATYICPMLCMLLQFAVAQLCGKRIGWAWYGAVTLLSLLLGPDKEAAAVFLALGYYPIIKPRLDGMKYGLVLKLLLFNTVAVVLYVALIYIVGMEQLLSEFTQLGIAGLAVMLVLGNVCFFLTDQVLGRFIRRKRRRKG